MISRVMNIVGISAIIKRLGVYMYLLVYYVYCWHGYWVELDENDGG